MSKWNFSLWPVLGFLFVLPALVWLGIWQVQRGVEKQAAYAAFNDTSDAVDITALPIADVSALANYLRVNLHGHYLDARQFLLDNMSHDGRPGHHVLTPFQPDNADYMLIVDRGWRPGLAAQARTENPRVSDDGTWIAGRLAPFARPALALSGKPAATGSWPRVVQFPDASDLSAQLDASVAERRLLLDPTLDNGFEREWPAPGIPPARHFAYAAQWFGLALALIVIFVLLARPKKEDDK